MTLERARLQRNVVANLAGQGWAAALALLLVPFYIRLLGIESYGLIGFFATLQAAFQVLDLGLSQTMNREMARFSAFPEKASEARDFVRTLELGYWAVGAVIGVSLSAAAPAIARHWIDPGTLSVAVVQRAVTIMGIVAALQWPLSFYEGGIMGLQRQLALNGLKIAISTLNGGGAVLVLSLVSPTITTYFTWQVVVSAIHVALMAALLWRMLPDGGRRAAFSARLLVANWRFAAGMSGISVSAIVLMHLDKVILSKLLTLEAFGYYTLAGVVTGAIPTLIVGPVFYAIFPRLTSLVARADEVAVKRLYHTATQLIVVIAITAAAVLGFFAPELLRVWTGSDTTSAAAAPLVSLLVIGAGLNAVMTLPYALQLAYGWTGLGLRINLALTAILVPSLVVMTTRYAAVGAAMTWAGLNAIYVVFGVPLTHRRLLRGEMRAWFLEDVVPAAMSALVVAGSARVLLRPSGGSAMTVLTVVGVLAVALVASALSAPVTRGWVLQGLPRPRPSSER